MAAPLGLLSHLSTLSTNLFSSHFFPSQATAQNLEDNEYANKIQMDAFFSKLKHLLMQYKPLDPLSFLGVVLDWLKNPSSQNDSGRNNGTIRLQRNNDTKFDCEKLRKPKNKRGRSSLCSIISGNVNNASKQNASSNSKRNNNNNNNNNVVSDATNTNMPELCHRIRKDDFGNRIEQAKFDDENLKKSKKKKNEITLSAADSEYISNISKPITSSYSKRKNNIKKIVPAKRSANISNLYHEIPEIVLGDHIGLDIGGSLCKICFYEPNSPNSTQQYDRIAKFIRSSTQYGSSGQRDQGLSFSFQSGKFHFLHFETTRMIGALGMIGKHGLVFNNQRTPATGGGAFKFCHLIKEQLGLTIDKRDEMKCLVKGLNFLLHTVEDECYYLEDHLNAMTSARITYPMFKAKCDLFPYLLVNIGSGVSFLLVDGYDKFKRVGGSFIGGATYMGLLKLITDATSFGEAMDLSISGTSTNVHMLVSDIYGGDYNEMGLNASTIAAAFGKLPSSKCPKKEFSQSDMAAGLLHMIGSNIGQLSYLTAVNYNINKIIFAGNFLRRNAISSGFLSKGIDYWSKGKMRALFLKHEGYFGSIGAMLNQ